MTQLTTFFPLSCRSERLSQAQRPADVHPISDVRVRERISLQPIPNAEATNRDSPRAVSNRASDQDLVPESADETEEGDKSGAGDQRTSETGEGGAGYDEKAAGGEAGQVAAGATEHAVPAAPRRRPRQGAERSPQGRQ